MGEVVNFRQARKRAGRRAKEVSAEANRVAFGVSTKLKAKARKETERREAAVDAHKLESPSRPRDDA